ncbi:MAG: glycine cleavage system aminomethyltransferase GcvT [Pseudomonadota bacterium]
MAEAVSETLKRTALYDLHVELGAKIVPFAGYEMPVQYPDGVMVEHNWTREHAGLFDVSHMGPCFLSLRDGLGGGDEAHERVAALIETLVPSDIRGLKPGQARLTVLLNDDGGILDDLIITRPEVEDRQGMLGIVVNGAVKEQDFALFDARLGGEAMLTRADDRMLLALQGPDAEAVLKQHFPGCEELGFMRSRRMFWRGEHRCAVTRCGYTGEDGFEVLIFAEPGQAFARELLADDRVKPIGLGARDSLRLEAGLCLYGHDMDAGRDPVEADLAWVIQKKRRARGDFPGAARILATLENGPAEKRVGVQPLDRAPAREGTEIQANGERIGVITSGGFGPTHGRPVAMGYVRADLAAPGTSIELMVRGKARPAEVCALPFVPHRYKR